MMNINVTKFNGIGQVSNRGYGSIELKIDMTKSQMFDAILEFQTKITDAELG